MKIRFTIDYILDIGDLVIYAEDAKNNDLAIRVGLSTLETYLKAFSAFGHTIKVTLTEGRSNRTYHVVPYHLDSKSTNQDNWLNEWLIFFKSLINEHF